MKKLPLSWLRYFSSEPQVTHSDSNSQPHMRLTCEGNQRNQSQLSTGWRFQVSLACQKQVVNVPETFFDNDWLEYFDTLQEFAVLIIQSKSDLLMGNNVSFPVATSCGGTESLSANDIMTAVEHIPFIKHKH